MRACELRILNFGYLQVSCLGEWPVHLDDFLMDVGILGRHDTFDLDALLDRVDTENTENFENVLYICSRCYWPLATEGHVSNSFLTLGIRPWG